MSLVELKVEIPAAAANAVDDVMLELGVEGWSLLEDAIAKRAWIVGVFDEEAAANERWRELQPLLANAGVTVTATAMVRPLGDADWRDSYKVHFHAWQFGHLHWVPIWQREDFKLPAGDAVLWLDPGLAFGTGNHETTRLCVERLVALAPGVRRERNGLSLKGKVKEETKSASDSLHLAPSPLNHTARGADRVIDAGCGSGILALSAVLLGFKNVMGFDNDAEAVRVSQENAALNGLAERVTFSTADLISGLAGRQAEVVLANIQADVLMKFSGELVRAVAPGGALILSGILAIENDTVRAAFATAAPGWKIETRVMGEWSDVLLMRPD